VACNPFLRSQEEPAIHVLIRPQDRRGQALQGNVFRFKPECASGGAEEIGALHKLFAQLACSGGALLLGGLLQSGSGANPGILDKHDGQDSHGQSGQADDEDLRPKAIRCVPGHG
jgi:hypothetical protein